MNQCLHPTPNAAANQPMSARVLLRKQIAAILVALDAANNTNWTIQSPGVWSTQEDQLPAVLVNAKSDQRNSWMRGESAFTTVCDIKIECRSAMHDTAAGAQDEIDAMTYAIENAVFTDYNLVRAIQQFVSTTTQTMVDASANGFIGSATFDLSLEVPEVFEPFPDGFQ